MTTADSEDTLPIADKVRFWEEQDKINQELIPRNLAGNLDSPQTVVFKTSIIDEIAGVAT